MTDPRIRRIAPDDVPAALALVHELAEYEREPQSCHLTAQQLHDALFTDSPALFGHVADVDGAVAGIALWFLNFSTWQGVHGIWLEDLYVSPVHRGRGLGRALLLALAEIAVQRGYARVEWSVLNWNTPSIDFYLALGAEPLGGWTTYRLTGTSLRLRADEA